MENLLLLYYGIITNYIYKKKTKFYFKYNDNIYILEELQTGYDLNTLEYLKYDSDYYKVVRNKYGDYVTKIYSNNYVLLEKSNSKRNIYDNIIDNLKRPVDNIKNNKADWIELWTKKLDYYESLPIITSNYKIINESLKYYIGMGETAISYIKYNFINRKEQMVISHKRINLEDYYNPVNTIVDYRPRDIAEFLKTIFLNGDYKKNDIITMFEKMDFNQNEYILLYGRMLFPNFYFDIIDQVINNKKEEKEIYKIVAASSEYEFFLNKIYEIICRKIKIPKINWILKY